MGRFRGRCVLHCHLSSFPMFFSVDRIQGLFVCLLVCLFVCLFFLSKIKISRVDLTVCQTIL